jgi:hypothetical protein
MTCKSKYEIATPKFLKGTSIKLCTDVSQTCVDYEKFPNKPLVKVCDTDCYGWCLRRG